MYEDELYVSRAIGEQMVLLYFFHNMPVVGK